MASDTVIRDEDKVRGVLNSLNFNISDKSSNYSMEWLTTGCIESAFKGIENAISNIEMYKDTVSSNISENESISSEIIRKIPSIVKYLSGAFSLYGSISGSLNDIIDNDGTKPTGGKKPTGRKKPSKKPEMVSDLVGDNINIFDESIFQNIPENTKIEILGQDQNGYIKVKIGDKEGLISTEVLTKYLTETGQSDLIKEISGQSEIVDKGNSKYEYATIAMDKSNEGLKNLVNDKNVINQDHTPHMGKGIAEEVKNGKSNSKYEYATIAMDKSNEGLKGLVNDNNITDQSDGEIL